MKNLKSSVGEKGNVVDQIVVFSQGNKKTFRGVITDTIQQGEMTRYDLEDGRRIYINPKNVDWFEVIN